MSFAGTLFNCQSPAKTKQKKAKIKREKKRGRLGEQKPGLIRSQASPMRLGSPLSFPAYFLRFSQKSPTTSHVRVRARAGVLVLARHVSIFIALLRIGDHRTASHSPVSRIICCPSTYPGPFSGLRALQGAEVVVGSEGRLDRLLVLDVGEGLGNCAKEGEKEGKLCSGFTRVV